jgi:type IV fimbrial biogenesis protein FimT/type IV fimbrial biogenesis protein FimU
LLNSNKKKFDLLVDPTPHSLEIQTSNRSERTYKNRGFSIVELMVAVAITGIILAIALPNLNVFIVKMRTENELSEMHRLLLTARNSAINTGLNTTVCPLDEDLACTDNWGNVISVFTNTTLTTTEMDANDVLIKVKDSVKEGDTLTLSNAGAITYAPTGRTLSGTVNQLIYCPFQYSEESNGIDISTSGRAYVGTENDSSQFVDRDGAPFKCT